MCVQNWPNWANWRNLFHKQNVDFDACLCPIIFSLFLSLLVFSCFFLSVLVCRPLALDYLAASSSVHCLFVHFSRASFLH